MMRQKSVLFVCTGNFYRSRFSEIYFRNLCENFNLNIEVFSVGFEVYKMSNKGPISKYTAEYLQELGIDFIKDRFPIQLEKEHFHHYDRIIAMDEKEHKPMSQIYFPEFSDRLEYWRFEDIQFIDPYTVLPKLKARIDIFFDELLMNT